MKHRESDNFLPSISKTNKQQLQQQQQSTAQEQYGAKKTANSNFTPVNVVCNLTQIT